MFCPKCGFQFDEAECNFCPKCGAPVKESYKPQPTSPASQPSGTVKVKIQPVSVPFPEHDPAAERKKAARNCIIFGVIFAVVLIVIAVACASPSPSSKSAESSSTVSSVSAPAKSVTSKAASLAASSASSSSETSEETVYTSDVDSLKDLFETAVGRHILGSYTDFDVTCEMDDSTGKTVTLTYMPKIYKTESFVYGRVSDYINYCRYVYQMEDVDLVVFNVLTVFTDSHGSQTTDTIIEVSMPKSVFETYNWANLEYTNVYDTFTEEGTLYIHPSMQEKVDPNDVFYAPDFDSSIVVK